ncbi:MAG: hypothetical protein NT031_13190 [Planctomycetota bacterium]|nr:hypothetical protein [Planctomycetota bacterium]
MNRTNSIGLFTLLALALVVPSCMPEAKTGQSDSEGGLKFTSELSLRVWVYDEGRGTHSLGSTTSGRSVVIPKGMQWSVEPLNNERVADVVAEARAKRIPGLFLARGSDADMAELRGWPGLQILEPSRS